MVTTDSPHQLFGNTNSLDFLIQQCEDIFGPQFNLTFAEQTVKNMKTDYGGLNYQGTRVIFTNGEIDPWHLGGFNDEPPNEMCEVIFIHGTAHCADMYPDRDEDPPQLTAARAKIESILGEWLNM
jgi:hypothetical protein